MKRDNDRQTAIILSIVGIVPVIWLALLIAPSISGGLPEIAANLATLFDNPFSIKLCGDSLKTVLILLLCYGMGIGIYFSTRKNYRRREEHGSAKWGNVRAIDKKYRQKPLSENKLMTQNVCIGLNAKKHRRNLNTLVCGGSGAGKTRFYGTAVMKSDLPFGKYYVKEIATDEHYILSDTKYPVVFEYAGQDTATVEIKVNDGKEIKNELIYGSVSGKKIDENGAALEGAVIGIFKAEETEFTKDTALMTTTSAKDGSFSFAKVPYGKWIVREIEQPKGFVLDEKAYEVNISKAEQVVEIEIVNEYVHGNIRLTKMDAEYPDNKLTGATFEVYKDTNENGKIDDGDELIGNLEETETGIYEMKELLYGKYIVRETKAPEGFLLDKGEYSVFIEKDETTYSVENKAGVGFINEAMRGTLKIVKTSSDGKVKGFAFRVTGANGYDMTFETDKNGEIVIEGLRIGEYTVSEVANNASAAYITPADQNVTIKLDETAVVKMHNELRDTPKTGDDTNMKLWYVLAGLSAVGIAVTSVVAHKKKKKESNE